MTIEIPEELVEAAERQAAKRGATLNEWVAETLRARLKDEKRSGKIRFSAKSKDEQAASMRRLLAQMEEGFHLGGKPLSREELHERR